MAHVPAHHANEPPIHGMVMLTDRGALVGHFRLLSCSSRDIEIEGVGEPRSGHLLHATINLDGDRVVSVPASLRTLHRSDTHSSQDGHRYSLRLHGLSPDQQDGLHQHVLRALLRDAARTGKRFLLLEPIATHRTRIRDMIESLGYSVDDFATFDSALLALEDDAAMYSALVVHSVLYDRVCARAVRFFAECDDLFVIAIPQHGVTRHASAARLLMEPNVEVVRSLTRSELAPALAHAPLAASRSN